MKHLLLALTIMTLAACSGGGGSGSATKKTGTGGGNLPRPTSVAGEDKDLFSNSWKYTFELGVTLVKFTRASTKVTTYCDNGLVASVTVSAANTATKIENLESDTNRVGDSETWCEAGAVKTSFTYSIEGDELVLDGQRLQAH